AMDQWHRSICRALDQNPALLYVNVGDDIPVECRNAIAERAWLNRDHARAAVSRVASFGVPGLPDWESRAAPPAPTRSGERGGVTATPQHVEASARHRDHIARLLNAGQVNNLTLIAAFDNATMLSGDVDVLLRMADKRSGGVARLLHILADSKTAS